jgi:hypothetical protein
MLGVVPERQFATCRWTSAIFRKIDELLVRYQAGKLRRCITLRAVTLGRKVVNKPEIRMPRRWGWLLLTGKHHAAYHGLQIQAVLARPEMVELLEFSPQAKRILRPLCRALAVELPWVIDRAAKAPGETKPRTRKPRLKPEPFRIPLPRGVLSAARRQGFGKMQ